MKKKRPIKLPKRQKVIPRHFTKRRKASLSEILRAASHGNRIKQLLQNNRALAAALEESHCMAASNNILLQSYTRDSNQILMARNKLRDMASTIQKLVGDLDAVLDCLDVSHLTSSTRFRNDVLRLRICAPDLETIEESPRSSVDGNENELMDNASPAINQLNHSEIVEKSTPVFDTSVTEIYNVNKFITNNLEKERGSEETAVLSTPTPQFTPPAYASKLADFAFEKPKDLEHRECVKQATSKATANTNLSKIPVRRPNLFCDPCTPDSPEAIAPSIRRETFVVNQLNKNSNDCFPVSNRRETYTLQELALELQAKKKADLDRRGTFAIPHLPPQKQDSKPGNSFRLPQETCTDDVTVHLPEDMELTEIIPSGSLVSVANEIKFSDFSLPANKNMYNSKALPSILKPISPIAKFKPSPIKSVVASECKPGPSKLKEGKIASKCFEEIVTPKSSSVRLNNKISGKPATINPLNEVFKRHPLSISHTDNLDIESPDCCHKSNGRTSKRSMSPPTPEELLKQEKLSKDQITSAETDFDAMNECKKLSRASRKSMLPNHPNETLKQQKLPGGSGVEVAKNFIKSNRASRKSVLPNPPKELSKQENQTNEVGYFEEVHECRRSNRISKKSVLPDSSKESSCRQKLSNDLDLSGETDLEAINECKKSNIASRKSVLPNPNEFLNLPTLSDDIDASVTTHSFCITAKEVTSIDQSAKQAPVDGDEEKVVNCGSKEPELSQEVSNDKPMTKHLKRISNICPKKSILPKISETSSGSSFSDMSPSDSEILAPEVPRKRIPGKRSLKPGRRGPFIFKKTRKSIPKLNNLDCADSKGYDFSSSDEDEEPSRKSRRSRKPPKKSSKMTKNKNTVAVLERDIGLMYQEQSRRKRSLKRKVSFANINVTPTNSDSEDKAKNSEEEIVTLEDVIITNDKCKKTSAPMRRSILKKQAQPACSDDKDSLSPDISSKIKHKLRKLSSLSNSEQSEEKLEYKKGEKSEEIEKQRNEVNGKNKGDGMESLVNVADKKVEGKPLEVETGDPLVAATRFDELNTNKKSKSSSAKSHKNSEFFGFESKRSKCKRTFSGVSERFSKKRVTATDDFLEDVDIAFPGENLNSGASVIESQSNAATNTHMSLTKPASDDLKADDISLSEKTGKTGVIAVEENTKSDLDIAVPVENEMGDVNIAFPRDNKKSEAWASALKEVSKTPVLKNTSSKNSNTKARKKTKTPYASDGRTEVKENARKSKSKNVLRENIKDISVTPPPSKARKTGSTESLKENLVIPDLESGGRSRRNRPTISFKEPSLNRKMRRN